MGTQVGALSVKIGADTTGLTKGLQQAVDNIRKFSKDAQAMKGSLRSVETAVSGLQVAFAGLAGLKLFGEAFTAADRMDAANRKLAATSRGLQIDFSALDTVSKQLQTTLSLSDPIADALAGQMSKLTSSAGQLNMTLPATIAFLDLAAANSISAAEAGELLNNILSGQDEGLNRLGLANPSGIYAEFAKQLGISAAKMTDAQKRMAILNAIIEAGKLQVGEYAKFTASAAGQTDNWRAQMDVAAASVGRALEGIRLAVMQGAAGALQILAVHADTLVRLGTVLAGIYVGRVAGAFAAATVQAIRTTISLIAQTAAIRGVTVAAASATVAVTGLRAAMALLGGPVGLLITVGASLAAMFMTVGGKAKDAAGQARAAAEEFRGALQTMDAATLTARANSNRSALRAIDAQVADLREGVLRDLDKLDEMEAGWAKNSLRGEVQLREGQIKQLQAQKDRILAEHAQVLQEARAREDAKVVVPEIVVPDTVTAKGKTPAQLLDEEITRLGQLADLRALTADEQTRILSLEGKLNDELRTGVRSQERRLELLKQIATLQEAQERSAPVMDVRAVQIGVGIQGTAAAPAFSGPPSDGQGLSKGDLSGGILGAAFAATDSIREAGKAMATAGQNVLFSFTPLGAVSAVLSGLFEGLRPVLDAFSEPLRIVGQVLATALVPIFKATFPIFKGLAVAATFLGQIIFKVAEGIAKAVGALIYGLGVLIKAIPGDRGLGERIKGAGRGITALGEGFADSADAMKEGREELKGLEWDDAMKRTTNGLNQLSDAMLNVPTGFKVAMARFNATSTGAPVASAVAAMGGGAGGTVINGGVQLHAHVSGTNQDPREIARAVAKEWDRELAGRGDMEARRFRLNLPYNV